MKKDGEKSVFAKVCPRTVALRDSTAIPRGGIKP